MSSGQGLARVLGVDDGQRIRRQESTEAGVVEASTGEIERRLQIVSHSVMGKRRKVCSRLHQSSIRHEIAVGIKVIRLNECT